MYITIYYIQKKKASLLSIHCTGRYSQYSIKDPAAIEIEIIYHVLGVNCSVSFLLVCSLVFVEFHVFVFVVVKVFFYFLFVVVVLVGSGRAFVPRLGAYGTCSCSYWVWTTCNLRPPGQLSGAILVWVSTYTYRLLFGSLFFFGLLLQFVIRHGNNGQNQIHKIEWT